MVLKIEFYDFKLQNHENDTIYSIKHTKMQLTMEWYFKKTLLL